MNLRLRLDPKQCLSIVILAWVAAVPSNGSHKREWQAGEYQGLTIGKSTRAQVLKKFGKAVWSGKPEEKLIDAEREGETWYEYVDVGGLKGGTTIVVGARSGIVKGVLLYPKDLTRDQAVRRYGSGYIARESKLGPCPTNDEIKKFKPTRQPEYPVFLVYPQLGMYLSIKKDNSVQEIGFLLRCP